jgi:amidophosphoribosyltransferase
MEHHCGVYGVSDLFANQYLIPNLAKLQHRGSESAGICYVNSRNKNLILYKKLGLVNHVFDEFRFGCITQMGIGHVRYSTRSKMSMPEREAASQPFLGKYHLIGNIGGIEQFALIHNGNIPNIGGLITEYNLDPAIDSDTLIIVKLLEKIYARYKCWETTLTFLMNRVPGAYCFIIMTNDSLFAMRDRFGLRPLCLGHRNRGGYAVASESVALGDHNYVRDVKAGEIIMITFSKTFNVKTVYHAKNTIPNFCSLEFIYFMNHKSVVSTEGYQDTTIENVRYQLGFALGLEEETILENSVTTPIPNASIPSGKGFADGAKMPYEELIIRNPDILRTFILPTQEERKEACELKFEFVGDDIKNKNIYLIDDSIVRGTTMGAVISKLKGAGAATVHVRIISPPVISPCYYGIDMSTKDELLANNKTVEEITMQLGADSVRYIDINKMKHIFQEPVCTSCFTGNYNKELLDW